MSVRFLNKLATEFTQDTVEDIKDLFDPRINRQTKSVYKGYLAKNTVALLNELFCKGNLADFSNFKMLMYDGTLPNSSEFAQMIAHGWLHAIPDDQMWLLSMMRRNGSRIIQETEGQQVSFLLPEVTYVTSSITPDIEVSWKSFRCATAEQFAAAVNTIHQSWHTKILNRPNHEGTRLRSSQLPFSSQLVRTYLFYCEGKDLLWHDEQYFNALKMAELLDADTNAQVTITIEHHRNIRWHINQPVSTTNRRRLYQIHNYSQDVLQILPYPNIEPKEKDPVLIGVELEVATAYPMKELIDAAETPFFIGKQDSSINGNKPYKVELVTAPSSFKFLRRQYAKWLNNLDYSNFDVTTTTNNGMHVHVGRDHFEDNYHIRNFCWFFNNPANALFLLQISERGTFEKLAQYSPLYQFGRNISRTKAFKDIYHYIGGGSFRGVTNFKGGWERAKTVEVRLFRGIVSYATIVKNLDFVESVFHFTKGLTSYRDLTLSGYIRWLNQQPRNKYILLRKFIDGLDMDKMLPEADVKDLIFTETNPERILPLLRKASFPITKQHLDTLNVNPNASYHINPATKEITLSYRDRGKLVDYDKSFASRYLRPSTSQVA